MADLKAIAATNNPNILISLCLSLSVVLKADWRLHNLYHSIPCIFVIFLQVMLSYILFLFFVYKTTLSPSTLAPNTLNSALF
mmetsp:Transcript_6759/g.12176  ORF Transcript_6759/g.12176 Transcript_6759/m.12176 type:complete len:82 (-) Transcript_6759:520-765(-)